MQILCPFFELQSHEIGEKHIFEDYLGEREIKSFIVIASSTAMEWKKIQMLFWIFCLLSLHCQMHSWLTNMFGISKFKRKGRKRTSKARKHLHSSVCTRALGIFTHCAMQIDQSELCQIKYCRPNFI